MNKTRKILLCALFIASTIILGRILSIRTPILTIGFSFIPIVLCAIILGPKYTIFTSTISDIIGSLLFPSGNYFFGFTITSFLTGLIYGFLLHRNTFKLDKNFYIRVIISTLLVTILLNGLLNTIWIIIISNNASKVIIPIRILKQLIMFPIKVISIISITKILESRIKELLND